MVYGTYNYILTEVYKATYNWGGPHCTYNLSISQLWELSSHL